MQLYNIYLNYKSFNIKFNILEKLKYNFQLKIILISTFEILKRLSN